MPIARFTWQAACFVVVCGMCALGRYPRALATCTRYTDAQGVVHIYNVHSQQAQRPRPRRATDLQIPMALLDAVIAESAELYKLRTPS